MTVGFGKVPNRKMATGTSDFVEKQSMSRDLASSSTKENLMELLCTPAMYVNAYVPSICEMEHTRIMPTMPTERGDDLLVFASQSDPQSRSDGQATFS
jgi:hypothetical protein